MCMNSGLGSAFTGRVKKGGKDVNQNRGHPREAKVKPGGGYSEAQNEVLSRVLSGGGATRKTQRRSGLPPPCSAQRSGRARGNWRGGGGSWGSLRHLAPRAHPVLKRGS